VLGKTTTGHTSAEFVAIHIDLAARPHQGEEIHVIADNLSACKTPPVAQFFGDHPNVHLDSTPTYSLWLSQIDLRFAKIERDAISRGFFPAVLGLKRKLLRYIRQYNKRPRPVKWKYPNPAHHSVSHSTVTAHYAPALTRPTRRLCLYSQAVE